METSSFIDKLYQSALVIARKAGLYLLDRFKHSDRKVTGNFSHDVKLDVDVETENIITSSLHELFPAHGFLCEESGQEVGDTTLQWVIDPLDGTVNFMKGIPHFCTSIAFRAKGNYLVGVVYDPIREELFSTRVDKGPFLNDSPLNRSFINNLEEAVISGGFFKASSLSNGRRIFEKLASHVKKIRFFGSAALDLCYLASGRVNGYIQFSVNEWDIAAALLIAEKAGVKAKVWTQNGSLNVVAADPAIFNTLMDFI